MNLIPSLRMFSSTLLSSLSAVTRLASSKTFLSSSMKIVHHPPLICLIQPRRPPGSKIPIVSSMATFSLMPLPLPCPRFKLPVTPSAIVSRNLLLLPTLSRHQKSPRNLSPSRIINGSMSFSCLSVCLERMHENDHALLLGISWPRQRCFVVLFSPTFFRHHG
jgi:hypothetical protein